MNKQYFLHFSVPLVDGERYRDFVESIGCLKSWREPFTDRGRPFLTHTFAEGDPHLAALRELLTKEGIEWSEREEHLYTDPELRSFPLLEFSMELVPLDPPGLHGTTFDLSEACPKCGTGAKQTSPLVLPRSSLHKRKGLVSYGTDSEILVATSLKKALQEAEVTGIELRQVVAKDSDETLPWWQVICEHTMPKASPQTIGWERSESLPPCPTCQQDGYYHTQGPYMIFYRREDVDLARIPDVAQTWESFGKSGIDKQQPQFSRFGDRRMLIKPKVFDIFRRLKVKRTRFTPVSIED